MSLGDDLRRLADLVDSGVCSAKGCSEAGNTLAVGRRHRKRPATPLGFYCNAHAAVVANEAGPEYEIVCAACGCRQGFG